jgi:hypothetical protein
MVLEIKMYIRRFQYFPTCCPSSLCAKVNGVGLLAYFKHLKRQLYA